MTIRELRAKAKNILSEYVGSKPVKEYPGYKIWERSSINHFEEISHSIGRHYGWVYAIFSNEQEQVKIGHTVRCPVERARRIFCAPAGTTLWISAFPCKLSQPHRVEGYVQTILYSCGLQNLTGRINNAQAYSGGTEIFNIKPSIACAMLDEAANELILK